MEMQWYALYTKPGFERKVSEALTRKKIENYFPVKKVLKSPGINNKLMNEPLFPNYIFVKAIEKDLNNLRKVTGIVSLVYWLGNPVVINDTEVKTMDRFLSDHVNISVEKMTLGNEITKIFDTSITIYDGNLMTIKNKTFNVILPSLGYVLTAQAETSNVRIISSENIVRRPRLMTSKLLKPVINFNNFLKN